MPYLLLISFIWAFSFGLIKGNLTGLSPDFVAFSRIALALLLFLPFFRKKNMTFQEALSFTFIGAVQYGLMYLFFIRSCHYLPAHLIVLFTACTPIYVTLIDNMMTKSFHLKHLIAAFIAFLGICALQYQNLEWKAEIIGIVFIQLSDLCFAFGQVAYKKIKQPSIQDSHIYALLFLGGALITALSTTLFGGWGSFFNISPKQTYLIVYLGIIASGLCFFGWNKAALKVKVGTLAVFNNIKIPLGVAVSILFFDEKAKLPPLLLSSLFLLAALFLTQKKSQLTYWRQKPTPDILQNRE